VSARRHIRVREEGLSLEALSQAVSRPGAGAIVIFCGVTREIPCLRYEAYREMAEARMRRIVEDCIERHGLEAAAAEHRVGEVGLGEPSVIVAASAAHRPEAFAGASEMIDRIKAEAPIWKREIGVDGSARWAQGNERAAATGAREREVAPAISSQPPRNEGR
jgi:molybdopterin synthase catalytic subunit